MQGAFPIPLRQNGSSSDGTSNRGASTTSKPGSKNALRQTDIGVAAADNSDSFCLERTAGRQRLYRVQTGEEQESRRWEGWEMVEDRHLCQLMHEYPLPQGYLDSVGHTFAPYRLLVFWVW